MRCIWIAAALFTSLLAGCSGGAEEPARLPAAEPGEPGKQTADTESSELIGSFDADRPGVFTVTENSAIVTAFYIDTGRGDGRFVKLLRGDLLRYTGKVVSFPTGASGFECIVIGIRTRSPEELGSAPRMNERCYLLRKEIVDYMVRVEEEQVSSTDQ